MRVLITSSFVPFVNGGGRFIVEWLETKLLEYGHEVEKFYLPFDERPETLVENLLSYRLMDMSQHADRLIAIRPPAHSLIHPNKVVWLFTTSAVTMTWLPQKYATFPNTADGRAIRDALRRHDTTTLGEARSVFTNSGVVKERLAKFNGIDAEVLYPPLLNPEQFYSGEPNDEIVTVCRVEPHKRQHLLIEAMQHVKTPVKLRICGKSGSQAYEDELIKLAHSKGIEDRIHFQLGWISEADKVTRVSNALASVYAPMDEDSYGYPTLEAAAAHKPTLTTWDAGGTLEFVSDGDNGLITDPSPQAIADGFDRLYSNRIETLAMGRNAYETVQRLNITWEHVVNSLLA
jgi:glycosyltransferase involved in cell wall biosynthesis